MRLGLRFLLGSLLTHFAQAPIYFKGTALISLATNTPLYTTTDAFIPSIMSMSNQNSTSSSSRDSHAKAQLSRITDIVNQIQRLQLELIDLVAEFRCSTDPHFDPCSGNNEALYSDKRHQQELADLVVELSRLVDTDSHPPSVTEANEYKNENTAHHGNEHHGENSNSNIPGGGDEGGDEVINKNNVDSDDSSKESIVESNQNTPTLCNHCEMYIEPPDICYCQKEYPDSDEEEDSNESIVDSDQNIPYSCEWCGQYIEPPDFCDCDGGEF